MNRTATAPRSASSPITSFAGQVGAIAAATVAVMGAMSLVWSWAAGQLIAPVVERAVKDEQIARASADSIIVSRLQDLSSDRVILVALMQMPPGPERTAFLEDIRRRWLK